MGWNHRLEKCCLFSWWFDVLSCFSQSFPMKSPLARANEQITKDDYRTQRGVVANRIKFLNLTGVKVTHPVEQEAFRLGWLNTVTPHPGCKPPGWHAGTIFGYTLFQVVIYPWYTVQLRWFHFSFRWFYRAVSLGENERQILTCAYFGK